MTATTENTAADQNVGHDDYALGRIPESKRYSWVNVAFQRFGQLSALAQFFLAAMIGIGMSFWDAMLAILLGSVLLEIVTIFIGIAGMREGLSTSVLARWTGFGRQGGALVGLAMAVSLTGWFAIQNEVFAAGLASIAPGPQWVWAVVGGLGVTAIVVYGFKWMGWVAYVTVPAFLALATVAVLIELQRHPLSELISSPPPGEPMSLATGTTIVAGGFIVGAVMTPDMSRFNRSARDVVKQTVVGVTFGEFYVGTIGVLLAHALKLSVGDAGAVIQIIQSGVGAIGVVILVISIVKINDWNLYPSSLGVTNALHSIFGVRVNRATITIVLGLFGTVLSALGFASSFEQFLVVLGVLFPPIAGIMIVDYFILRTWRKELDESREHGLLPSVGIDWNIAGLLAWGLGAAPFVVATLHPEVLSIPGIPALNSLALASVLYFVFGKMGLARTGEKDVSSDNEAAVIG